MYNQDQQNNFTQNTQETSVNESQSASTPSFHPMDKPPKKNRPGLKNSLLFLLIMAIVIGISTACIQGFLPFSGKHYAASEESPTKARQEENDNPLYDLFSENNEKKPGEQKEKNPSTDSVIENILYKINNAKSTTGKDKNGKPIITITFDFANLSTKDVRFTDVLYNAATQNGAVLYPVSYTAKDKELISAKVTKKCSISFYLNDTTSDVNIQIATDFIMKNKLLNETFSLAS